MKATLPCPDEWPIAACEGSRPEEDPSAALKRIRAARKRRGDSPSLAAEAGRCYEALGEAALARREYARAAALDPGMRAVEARIEALDRAEEVARTIATAILGELSTAR